MALPLGTVRGRFRWQDLRRGRSSKLHSSPHQEIAHYNNWFPIFPSQKNLPRLPAPCPPLLLLQLFLALAASLRRSLSSEKHQAAGVTFPEGKCQRVKAGMNEEGMGNDGHADGKCKGEASVQVSLHCLVIGLQDLSTRILCSLIAQMQSFLTVLSAILACIQF